MALTHLVDTSVLTRISTETIRDVLGELATAGVAGRPTVVDLELGFSARNGDEWDSIARSLALFVAVDVEPHHFRRAGQVQRLLAERGLRGRKVPDLLVAACAEDHGLVTLHYDADFDHIASVTGQRSEWVVPAGSMS